MSSIGVPTVRDGRNGGNNRFPAMAAGHKNGYAVNKLFFLFNVLQSDIASLQ